MGVVWRAPAALLARLDQLTYLLMPFWQTIVGASLVVAIVLAVIGEARSGTAARGGSSCSSTCSASAG